MKSPLSLLAALALCLPYPAAAQSDPFVISRVDIDGEGEIDLAFRHPQGAGGFDFRLQRASALDGGWEEVTGAIFTASAEGGAFSLPRAGSTGYFRVVATPGEGGGPDLYITEIMPANETVLEDADGDFPDWVEIFNAGDSAAALGNLYLSDDVAEPAKWRFPDVTLEPGAYLVVFLSGKDRADPEEPHASFQLRNGQESILLGAADGTAIDRFEPGPVAADGSFGRAHDDLAVWYPQTGTQATPGLPNNRFIFGAPDPYVEPPRFSLRGGVYADPVTVTLEPPVPGDAIRYTLDGQEPEHTLFASNSTLYTEPMLITGPATIRARIFGAGNRRSGAKTVSYIVGAGHELPVLALASEPDNFDFKDGYLYGMGSALSSSGQVNGTFPYSSSNAWMNREAAIHVEFFEADNSDGFNMAAGVKIFGGWGSRGYAQKSMALFARREYGYGRIRYPLFPDTDVDSFESVVLRNSGNDNQSTHLTVPRPPITAFSPPQSHGSYFVNGTYTLFRDAMIQSLVRETGLDTQAYRPVVVYLNGDYWGIYNLREKLSEHYVASHHGVAPDQVDLIEGYGSANAGSASAYNAMRSYVGGRSMADPDNFAFVEENHLDIDNFIDYHLTVIYCQNFDIGNIKCWSRRDGDDHRFRWMVYDQDYGFGLWPAEVYEAAMARDYADYRNMFRFYTNPGGSGTGWPNAGGRTLLLRSMLDNEVFFRRFVNRCADLLNTLFAEDRVVERIDSFADRLRPEIPAHLARWSWEGIQARGFGHPHKEEDAPLALAQWESHVEILRAFARQRPAGLRQDLIDHFQLENGLADLVIEAPANGEGRVRVHTVTPDALPWTGRYFVDLPPEAEAVPAPGFVFDGWTRDAAESEAVTIPDLSEGGVFTLRPSFRAIPVSEPSHLAVTVSEIHYHPAPGDAAGEWLELHNRGDEPVELEGWVLMDGDDDNRFVLPAVTLEAGGFLVLCGDPSAFQSVHALEAACLGPLGFSLSNGGERIRVLDDAGALIADFVYDDASPWPEAPDGTGPSLERTHLEVDPGNPEAWEASEVPGGTPGR